MVFLLCWVIFVLIVACVMENIIKDKAQIKAMWAGVAVGLAVNFFLILFR